MDLTFNSRGVTRDFRLSVQFGNELFILIAQDFLCYHWAVDNRQSCFPDALEIGQQIIGAETFLTERTIPVRALSKTTTYGMNWSAPPLPRLVLALRDPVSLPARERVRGQVPDAHSLQSETG
jgi:hypothetical protein